MSEANRADLIGGPKHTVIRGRVPVHLVKAAKKHAEVVSDTELIEVALSKLAQLQRLKASIDPDLDLEF